MGYQLNLVRAGGGLWIEGTSGEDLTIGQVCYLNSSGVWMKADVDSLTTVPALGMAITNIGNGLKGKILLYGPIGKSTWTWTPGGKIYASATAGSITQTKPTPAAGGVSQELGIALSATMLLFQPKLERMDDECRMRVLTYTGDGNATKAITGAKFQPDFVIVYPQLAGGTYTGLKVTADGTKTFVDRSGSNNNAYEDDHVISLDADGITVGDGTGGVGNFFNVLNRVYVVVCFKNDT